MKIEKCPFCGGEAIPCSTGNHFAAEKFFVACGVCGVETPRIARTRKEAIAAWNRRAQHHIGDTTEMIGQPENEPLDWLDVLIEYWHTHETGNELHEFLGLTQEEYGEFISSGRGYLRCDLKITLQNKTDNCEIAEYIEGCETCGFCAQKEDT